MRENRTEKCMELVNIGVFVIKKEIKCSGDSEILHEIVRDTLQISLCFADFR